MKKPLVGILVGSDSDLGVMKASAEILDLFEIPYDLSIISAHTTPKTLIEYAESATKRGIKVIIAGSADSALLPGMCAAHTTLPVIGVPIDSKSLQGLDALLSIAQMPPGVPVATVAIDGAKNAGILAAEILGTIDLKVRKKLTDYKKIMQQEIEVKAERMRQTGFQKYLNGTGPL